MWYQLSFWYHSILPDTTVRYSTDSITIIGKFTCQISEQIQLRYALIIQNKLDIQLKLGTGSLNQNTQRACPRLYSACSCNWLTLNICWWATIVFCLVYCWQGSNSYTYPFHEQFPAQYCVQNILKLLWFLIHCLSHYTIILFSIVWGLRLWQAEHIFFNSSLTIKTPTKIICETKRNPPSMDKNATHICSIPMHDHQSMGLVWCELSILWTENFV